MKKREIIDIYVKSIVKEWSTGVAKEHSYRPALHNLIESLCGDVIVVNEPKPENFGAPDVVVLDAKSKRPCFYMEAKDIDDRDLDGRRSNREQFTRYKHQLDNIVFTDYLDFHYYRYGEFNRKIRLIDFYDGDFHVIEDNVDSFIELIESLKLSQIQKINKRSVLIDVMAAKCELLRDAALGILRSGDVSKFKLLCDDFKITLLSGANDEQMADVFAQTITYGMFAARLYASKEDLDDFSRVKASILVPQSNPFLRGLFQFIAATDLDVHLEWIVDDLALMFKKSNTDTLKRWYEHPSRRRDPLVDFFEDFLTKYNPKQRKYMGVWYTPIPIANFIVRAVDNLLKVELGINDGLADKTKIKYSVHNPSYQKGERVLHTLPNGRKTRIPMPEYIDKDLHRVQILDPAVGTGTFLAEIINHLYSSRFAEDKGMWPSYVKEHLKPRMNGFELMMSSQTIAHIKLNLLLNSLGVVLDDDRLNVLLTDSLEESIHGKTSHFFLSNEAKLAEIVKNDRPVMVMIGNPPYGKGGNKGRWITELMKDYKQGLKERKTDFDLDYLKFIRLAQYYIDKNSEGGLVGYVTNNEFLGAMTYYQVRFSLLRSFDKIYILNLRGSLYSEDRDSDGSIDENVFGIKKGVCISLFVKTKKKQPNELGEVFYHEISGRKRAKFDYLDNHDISNIKWIKINLSEPRYYFLPVDEGTDEYRMGFALDELFVDYKSGIQSKNNDIAFALTEEEMRSRIEAFKNLSVEKLKIIHKVCDKKVWKVTKAKSDIETNPGSIEKIMVRPFDNRFTYYTGKMGFMMRPRTDIFKHRNENNIFLVSTKQLSVKEFRHIFVSRYLNDENSISTRSKEQSYLFPLYCYSENEYKPNLSSNIWNEINKRTQNDTTPEEIIGYVYAVLYSPKYRKDNQGVLQKNFARIPYPSDYTKFKRLADLGNVLIRCHLMENVSESGASVSFPNRGSDYIEYVKYKDGIVHINDKQYFANISEDVWDYVVGSCQPLKKWLTDRIGRKLNYDDEEYYKDMVKAISKTLKIEKSIDGCMN